MQSKLVYKNFKIISILAAASLFLGALYAQSKPAAQGEDIIVSRVEYKAGALRDPLLPYGRKEEKKDEVGRREQVKPLPALRIEGIIWGTPIPQAIINGMVLKEGDSISEAMISKIDKEGVELFYYGRSYFLSAPASGGQIKGR